MEKRKIISTLAALLMLWNYSSLNAQEDSGNQENAFYMNGKKIDQLSCYEFETLSVVFPVPQEAMGYDLVYLTVTYSNNAMDFALSPSQRYDGNVFRAKYGSLKQGTLVFFKKDEQTTCLNSGYMTRTELKYYFNEKGVTTSFLVFSITGKSITGYEEKLVGDRIEKTPVYSNPSVIYESPRIPLTNKIKVNLLKYQGLKLKNAVDLTVPCNNQ